MGSAPAAKPPNIILIMTDQQRYDTIAALGYPYMHTPALDRLGHEGTAFTRCYITGASCVPSRASLFTGYYPHTIGVLRNGAAWRRTWIENLAAAGYRCVNVGKMHTIPFTTPAGFHERYNVENKDRFLEGRYYFDEWDKALAAHGLVKQQRALYRQRADYRERLGAFTWDLPEHLHSDFFVGNLAKWWINSHPPVEPLFLQIGFPGPHPPYDPIARYAEPYLAKQLPLPQVNAADLDGQPPAYKILRQHNTEFDHDSILWSLTPSHTQLHRMWAHYCANMTMIDEKIGEILDALKDRGYLDNAVVFFTTDHGDCMGHHGHSQKWTMYEDVVRVPLIAWSPGRIPPGARIDGICQLMDLGATILDLAKIPLPESFEARSLAPAMEGAAWQAREHVFTEQEGDSNLTGTAFETMVRSNDWKLVHFLGEPHGQLFDLRNDPREEINLWDAAEHAGTKRELLDVLREWRIESGFRTRSWASGFR
jgi:arylsulfatase A-like enzyme